MLRARYRRLLQSTLSFTLLAVIGATPVLAQRGGGSGGGADGPLPSIADKTAGMERLDGFLPLYWDSDLGQLWMENCNA